MMKRKISCINHSALIVIVLLLMISSVYGQQSEDTVQLENAAPPVQQQVEDNEGKFIIEGHLLELIKRKISEEQFKIILNETEDKELSQEELQNLLVRAGVKNEDIQTFLQETDEYLQLADKVRRISPIALTIKRIEGEIKNRKKELQAAQSDDVKSDISDAVKKLQKETAVGRNRIAEVSQEIKKAQLEQLAGILRHLGYEEKESDIIALRIETQVDLIKKISTIESIIESIDKNKIKIKEMELEQKKAQTDEEKAVIAEELKMIGDRLEALHSDFAILITGVDRKKLFQNQQEESRTDWNKELQEVFSPLIVQLKQVTERPRQMEMLRS